MTHRPASGAGHGPGLSGLPAGRKTPSGRREGAGVITCCGRAVAVCRAWLEGGMKRRSASDGGVDHRAGRPADMLERAIAEDDDDRVFLRQGSRPTTGSSPCPLAEKGPRRTPRDRCGRTSSRLSVEP